MLDSSPPRAGIPDAAEEVRFGARAVLAGVAIALVAVPFGLLLLMVQSRWSPLVRIDDGARDALYAIAVDEAAFVTALKLISIIGSAAVYVPLFAVLAAWLAWRRLGRLAVFVVVTMLGSWLLNSLVKLAVDRARPVLPDPVAHAGGMSFPSGHAQSATVAAAVLLLVFLPALNGRPGRRRIAVAAALVWVVVVAFSRVGLGVHYVSDVLAGAVLGAAWVSATTALFSVSRRQRGQPPVEPSQGLEPEHAARLGAGEPPR
ncbi:MAG TPA: phosphatase PAP2 family protein [Solirubrobacteraceae bacterium]|jgi:membrane-associated phospholipid phosphatase|nr:phosphatase PAP2 family protein [Solirubrobacteraceae bacterium]